MITVDKARKHISEKNKGSRSLNLADNIDKAVRRTDPNGVPAKHNSYVSLEFQSQFS
jgi:hypothetical protein